MVEGLFSFSEEAEAVVTADDFPELPSGLFIPARPNPDIIFSEGVIGNITKNSNIIKVRAINIPHDMTVSRVDLEKDLNLYISYTPINIFIDCFNIILIQSSTKVNRKAYKNSDGKYLLFSDIYQKRKIRRENKSLLMKSVIEKRS